jgi:rare lipoprotein A
MASRLLASVVFVCAATPAVSAPPARDSHADYVQTGMASYYSQRFEGRRTANGETFRNDALTAAHPTYPFGTLVRVTSVKGHSVDVRITDRLPSRHAIIDLTQRAAAQLDMLRAGKERVTVQVLQWGRGAQQALTRVVRETPIVSDVIHAIEGSSTAD